MNCPGRLVKIPWSETTDQPKTKQKFTGGESASDYSSNNQKEVAEQHLEKSRSRVHSRPESSEAEPKNEREERQATTVNSVNSLRRKNNPSYSQLFTSPNNLFQRQPLLYPW
ncbi:hypothetical protein F0562_031769 [Nyssa sinensis]|uniref:Uncharacterized protein n=1 Tax=Nyssa sinensis TaxID=561372 RepID=A0A5J5AWZ3_9ASTE|nr:hypothetical protein F0562_031769 [Nyssa sinensis]